MKNWTQKSKKVEYQKSIKGHSCFLTITVNGADTERIEMDVLKEESSETLMQVRYNLNDEAIYSPPINIYMSPKMPKEDVPTFLGIIEEVLADSAEE